MKPTYDIDHAVIRFAGDSGDGIQIIGSQFAAASALTGNDIRSLPDFPAEIRAPEGSVGGVSSFQIQFGAAPIYTAGDACNALIAMNAAALKASLSSVAKGGAIVANTAGFSEKNLRLAGYVQNPLEDGSLAGYSVFAVDITKMTALALADYKTKLSSSEIERAKNFFALGMIYWLYHRPIESTAEWIRNKFSGKADILNANTEALFSGWDYAVNAELFTVRYHINAAPLPKGRYRSLTGNVAIALGLTAAAQKARLPLLFAGYPITPASDILHTLSSYKRFGVKVIQAEDEIAAIAATLGASFGGNLAATASSGPGMSLKIEALGLGVMAELPLVVVDVQRAGPSTGMPTKTEQSDLLQSLYGRHGEAPLPVLAAASAADCFDVAFEASRIALKYMTPVIVLSDSYLWEFGKWSVRLGWCLQAACVVGIVLHGLVPISVMHRLLNLFAVLVIVFMIFNAVIAIRRGFRPAAYFLAAWMMFFTGAVIFILSNFAIIPKTPLVQFSIQIGSALEMLLLSFALGDRISLMRKEREAAQKKALQGEIYRLRTIELAEANEEIERQKEVLEEQAGDIEVVNTMLQEQNERLRELDNEKNEFLGIAAHDLKNPLGAMRGMMEVLVMDNERMDAPDRLVFLRQTLLTIDRMVELVRNLLDINAIERGGITLSPVRQDVTSLLREVLEEYEYHAAAKSLTLRLDAEKDITAKVDKKALRQVLDNLVSNALKYSPKGKSVTVRVSQIAIKHEKSTETDILGHSQITSLLRIEIRDEGPGLTEQDMKRLFGKFVRLSARPTAGEHSTGLGLSIVKRLVDAMNGRVWCESEHGKGATFIVEIPD